MSPSRLAAAFAAASLTLLPSAGAGPGVDFLEPYGIENFPEHYVEALDTLLLAQIHAEAGEWAEADVLLDALWESYPIGDSAWGYLPTRPSDIFLGTPPCYYALRMLTDLTDHRLANASDLPPPRTATLTVLVVGQSSGIQPRTTAELDDGEGVPVTNTVVPSLLANDGRIIEESLDLFAEYAEVVTKGRLGVDVRILPLLDIDLPVHAYSSPVRYAGPVRAADVFEYVPQEIAESTDWWWLLYPSHVPEQYPDFEDTEFITGGMGRAPNGGPFFIIDDRWLTRKPPHLADGVYTTVERTTYLPQWLQHEFFHHLYRSWPEFGLEEQSHQWFDPATWPDDFEGRYEPDYYHESLFRRLHDAHPQPHVALRYSTADAPFDQVTPADILGTHYRVPSTNGWHIGDIERAGGDFRWRNTAGVSWSLTDDLANGRLLTGPDNPYAGNPSAGSFDIVLEREPEFGDLTADAVGFRFLGEFYRCRCARVDLAPPSRTLDLADITAFVVAIANDETAADIVAPFGVIDLADITAFVGAFSAGCP